MKESEALVERGEGVFALSGKLTRVQVAELWPLGVEKFSGLARVDLDLAGVSLCDSAGVAMLLDWLRVARASDQELRFLQAPQQMLAIARVSDLVPVLEESAGDA